MADAGELPPPPDGAEETYAVEHTVLGVAPERVYRFMCRPEAYPKLHPLLEEVHVEAEGQLPAGGAWMDLRMVDRIKLLGCVPWRLEYTARQRCLDGERVIESAVRAPSGVRMWHRFSFAAGDGGSTRVTDSVIVTAPRLVRGHTVRTAREAHAAFLASLSDPERVDWSGE